jgi:ribosomal protein S18 acetylase RimI-like enzyme
MDDFKRRIEAIEDIQLASSPASKVERSGGVQLSAFDRDTQSVINEALIKRSAGDRENILKKLKPLGADGLRAFAEFDRGQSNGEQFVNIIDQLGIPLTRSLITRYLAIIDAANNLTSESLKQTITPGADKKLKSGDISRGMRERADAILLSIGKRGSVRGSTGEDIVARLSNIETDVILLASVVRGAKELTGKPLAISELAGLSIRSVTPQEVESNERGATVNKMRALLDSNWTDKGKDAAAGAREGLENALRNPEGKTRFYILERDGKLLGFMRFDDMPDLGKKTRYAGSFNVIPSLQNASLGSAFFRETLASEGKDHTVLAHALATDRAASLYVEDFGFVITGVERDKVKNGKEVAWFSIRRDKNANEELKKRQKEFPKNSKVFNNLPEFLSWVEQESSRGRVISRYKISTHGKMTFYEAVSERLPD